MKIVRTHWVLMSLLSLGLVGIAGIAVARLPVSVTTVGAARDVALPALDRTVARLVADARKGRSKVR
jgi:hypothetical protein